MVDVAKLLSLRYLSGDIPRSIQTSLISVAGFLAKVLSERYYPATILFNFAYVSLKVYLVLRTRDKRQFAMKIHDFRHPMHIDVARSLLKELVVQNKITGRPFLSGMTDMWYSSAKFFHVITVGTKTGNRDSTLDLTLLGTLPWWRPAAARQKFDKQANVACHR